MRRWVTLYLQDTFFIAPGLSYIEEEGKDPTIRIEGMVNG